MYFKNHYQVILIAASFFFTLSTTILADDTTTPTPNPATFNSVPVATGPFSITMNATTGSDTNGPVEYYFSENSGNHGGNDSGWQESPTYTDEGLAASTEYTYTVCMRDSLGNIGTASNEASATTQASTPIIRFLDSTIGSDSYDGTSATVGGGGVGPWASILHAYDSCASVDNEVTVHMADGDYSGFSEGNFSINNHWIVFQASGDHARIMSSISFWRYPKVTENLYIKFDGIHFYHSSFGASYGSYVELLDCTFTGDGYEYSDGSCCIRFAGNVGALVSGCTITGDGAGGTGVSYGNQSGALFFKSYEKGIYAEYNGGGSDGIIIRDCNIISCAEGITMRGDGMQILNNEIQYCSDDGIALLSTNADSLATTVISGNHIHHLGKFIDATHCDYIQTNDAYGTTDLIHSNMIIRNNICHDGDDQGFFLRTDTSESKNWIIENNLLYNNNLPGTASHAFRVFSVNGLVLRNNTVVFGPDGTNANILIESYSNNCNVTYLGNNICNLLDIYTDNGDVVVARENHNLILGKGYHCNNHTWGSGTTILSDAEMKALFADYDNADFTLASDSFAIDKVSLSDVYTTDRNNNSRVDIAGVGNDGSNYGDIGCYERSSISDDGPNNNSNDVTSNNSNDVTSNNSNDVTSNNSNDVTNDNSTIASSDNDSTSSTESDTTAPSVSSLSPTAAAMQTPLNTLISFNITDAGDGVDGSSVEATVNGVTVYTGNVSSYTSSLGICTRRGTTADYQYTFQPDSLFGYDQTVTVVINASDLAGNVIHDETYSFTTEMRSYGKNNPIAPSAFAKGSSCTIVDRQGIIWSAWHQGSVGSRDVFFGKLNSQTGRLDHSVQITNRVSDQCYPTLAVDTNNRLFLAWQDNSQTNWDICVSTSLNGSTWSAEVRITDPVSNQTSPVIAVTSQGTAYIAWEDDRNGNTDIYGASSSNLFTNYSQEIITTGVESQTQPTITIDGENNAYVFWTDMRNRSQDIYGASSETGWTDTPVVTKTASQNSPSVAADPCGATLYLAWTDDISGNQDVYYAELNGLPDSTIQGTNIIDDSSEANQMSPSVAVTRNTSNALRAFICWIDYRSVGGSTDTDLYIVDASSSSDRTNILIGDEQTNSNQLEPILGIDYDGEPFVFWTDDRSGSHEIYYCGSTYVVAQPLCSRQITAAEGGRLGPLLTGITSTEDIIIDIPAGAVAQDVEVSISEIRNPPSFDNSYISGYEFGPSGMEFTQPVTITIPYRVSQVGTNAMPYWYNSLADSISQNGISDVQKIEINSDLHALQFKTTHFTPYYVLDPSSNTSVPGNSGGGGCALSNIHEGKPLDWLLPVLGLFIFGGMNRLRTVFK